MGTDIEKREASTALATAGSLDEMMRAASALCRAGDMVPQALRNNAGGVLAVIMTARELGIGPMTAMRSLHLVKGKVVIDYSLLIGLVRREGYGITWSDCGPESATLTLTAPDDSTYSETWDKSRAQRAELWGSSGTWTKYPETMLKARCVSSAVRAFVGNAFAGVYVEGELDESPQNGARIDPDGHHAPHSADVAHPLVEEARELAMEEDAYPRFAAWCETNGDALRALSVSDKKALYAVLKSVVEANDECPTVVVGEWLAAKPAKTENEDEAADAVFQEVS